MIHTSRYDGSQCGGTLIPCGPKPFGHAADWHRCDVCGQVGVPYIPTKVRDP
jgi:hypothetical protein